METQQQTWGRGKRIANRAGICPGSFSKILSGKRRAGWDVAKRLAAATGTEERLWIEGPTQARRAAIAAMDPSEFSDGR